MLRTMAKNPSPGFSTSFDRTDAVWSQPPSRFHAAPISKNIWDLAPGDAPPTPDGAGQGIIADQQSFSQRDRPGTWLFETTRSYSGVSQVRRHQSKRMENGLQRN